MDRNYMRTWNKTMEPRVAAEALRGLPKGMLAWLSTHSNDLKMGITEWIHNWKRNGWKNLRGNAFANVTLWKELLEAVGEHADVRFTLVEEHRGILFNECADMLATRRNL
jgi:ribonuclease HI